MKLFSISINMKSYYAAFLLVVVALILQFREVLGAEKSKLLKFKYTPEKIYYGCFTLKGCIAPNEGKENHKDADCIENINCNQLVAYGKPEQGNKLSQDEVVIELYVKTQRWIAIGLSQDKKMGQDYVIELVRDELSNIPNIYNSWNFDKRNKRMIGNYSSTQNIRVQEILIVETAIYCKLYIKKVFTKVDPFNKILHKFNLEKDTFCLLIAWGDKLNKGNLGIHTSYNNGSMSACKEKISLARQFSPPVKQAKMLLAHGMAMTVAWVFLISISNFIRSHFKNICMKKCTCVRCWICLHYGFVLLSLFVLAIGVYSAYEGLQGWRGVMGESTFHVYGGFLVLLIYAVNLILGVISKPKSLDTFSFLELVHTKLSHLNYLLACILMAETPKLPFSTVSCSVGYVFIGWIVIYIFLNFIMSYHEFWVAFLLDEEPGGNSEPDLLSALTEQDKEHQQLADNPAAMSMRKTSLLAYIFISLCFAAAICLMLLFPPVGPCYFGESNEYFEDFTKRQYKFKSRSNPNKTFVVL